MGKILQYELWQECNNFCDYCTLGHNITKTPNKMKLQSLVTTFIELTKLKKLEKFSWIKSIPSDAMQ